MASIRPPQVRPQKGQWPNSEFVGLHWEKRDLRLNSCRVREFRISFL